MKKLALFSFLLGSMFLLPGCQAQVRKTEENIVSANKKIRTNLDNWHRAAAQANFDEYFGLMTSDAVFIGTDATENWQIEEFKEFSRPYFEAGKAWDFEAIERNVYVAENRRLAWFDELLDTHMGICRGSGVMAKENGKWKVKHYVLSIAIPNENVKEITQLKKDFDQKLISSKRSN